MFDRPKQYCRKHRFRDLEEVKDALTAARRARYIAEHDGVVTARREARYYHCYRCLGWHLTSQAQHNQVVA